MNSGWHTHTDTLQNSRRIYIVNNQLKIAYRAQQKAQIAESKASHAKKRFASYIFHEVRVPLNTAWLSYENLKSENAFRDEALVHQNVELYALEASLTMMQQVLNDALDLESAYAFLMPRKEMVLIRVLQRWMQGALSPHLDPSRYIEPFNRFSVPSKSRLPPRTCA